MDVVRQPLPRLKVVDLFSRLPLRNRSLEMTLHADVVALLRRQLSRLHMSISAAMASLTRNPRMQKWKPGKLALRPCDRRLHSATVTVQTIHERRQIQRTLLRLRIRWSHVPSPFLRVPVDGSLEQESVHRKKIRPPFHSGPNEIQQFAPPRNPSLSADSSSTPDHPAHTRGTAHPMVCVGIPGINQPPRHRSHSPSPSLYDL